MTNDKQYIDKGSADLRPERYSEWIERNGTFECKKCSYAFDHEGYLHFFNFCPCCGAKMDRKKHYENDLRE